MFIISLGYIRRNYFEVFYYYHVIFMLMGILSACYHENACFAFFIPALILWFADRLVRSYKSWFVKTSSVRVDQVVPLSDKQDGIVRILFENKVSVDSRLVNMPLFQSLKMVLSVGNMPTGIPSLSLRSFVLVTKNMQIVV